MTLLSELKSLFERRYARLKLLHYEHSILSMHKRALDELVEVEGRRRGRVEQKY